MGSRYSPHAVVGAYPLANSVKRIEYVLQYGVSGLFVADNSVLPTLPSANPTLITVALAIRTADYISRIFR